MPQMAPLNWITLFASFCIYMLIFSSMNYFFFMKNPLKKSKKINKLIQFWPW
uniref:ATP synthase F0 subunit 8 n=1 Tax=Cryptocephalus dimidiatipennis TaxID=2978450 RepID=UPI0021CC6B98|nr:ATP synthase F0 subunit 8 [Cryptocephalus dimidiatipennis]UWV18200.1 ATP synthase F0 subunit 8 [Cryptocephalus dimidiatipennis]